MAYFNVYHALYRSRRASATFSLSICLADHSVTAGLEAGIITECSESAVYVHRTESDICKFPLPGIIKIGLSGVVDVRALFFLLHDAGLRQF